MPDFHWRNLYYGITITFLIFFLGLGSHVKAQKIEDVPLLNVIAKLQADTQLRFLYRESLINNIRVTLDLDDDNLIGELREQLKPYSVDVLLDDNRSQILLLEATVFPDFLGFVEVSGQVVDSHTGERLPYATLSWTDERANGVIANSTGSFRITRENSDSVWNIKASYVGYEPREITLNLKEYPSIRGLTIRLSPKVIQGMNILITDVSYYASKDSSIANLVNTGKFSPLGESNAVRSLQVLPSVSLNTAMNEGLNIRGSNPDGFQVILDGMSIFNQNHLFGLLDSFNDDAIQTNNFFYDVTPAIYQASTGGTLSLLTRTGSQQGFNTNAGLSNSSVKATAEGPLNQGSSWLLSARHSFMNTISWFNNPYLIKWGLDIDRPRNVLADNLTDLNAEVVDPGDSEVRFLDLHGKIYHESSSGSRLMASAYYGGDYTRQTAFRNARIINPDIFIEAQNVETVNDWGNLVASIQYQREFGGGIFSQTMAGISAYETSYTKDDFVYTRITNQGNMNQVSMFTYPFYNESTLNEIKAKQTFDVDFTMFSATFGAAWFYYMGDYFEESFDRPGFLKLSRSSQIDAFAHLEIIKSEQVRLQTGSRFQFYSAGKYLKWSPRVKLRLFPESPVTLGAGYSRNYQFLHRVGFAHAVTSDVWVLSDTDQPPSSVNHYSAGIYIKPFSHSYLQVETYFKKYHNQRLHEVNTQSLSNAFAHTPWFHENEGTGKGIEFLMRNSLNQFITVSQTYTISEMILQNLYLYDGNPFYADWDRRHRYSATIELELMQDLQASLSWNLASGAPNRLAQTGEQREDRLSNYRRFDISMQYTRSFTEESRVDMKFSVFNLFNNKNTWYREYSLAIDDSRSISRLSTIPVDVYDLGFHPSFEVVFSF
ncbi:MAG: carboxypeptidase-like regulatory domain-containing protein [Balneolales bacterium]